MIVLPNMGLVKWESLNDFFSHEQLASNFQLLDDHDHTAGKGKQISYGGLGEQSVGSENLREDVLNASFIADGSITSNKYRPTIGLKIASSPLNPVPNTLTLVPGLKITQTPTINMYMKLFWGFNVIRSPSEMIGLEGQIQANGSLVEGGLFHGEGNDHEQTMTGFTLISMNASTLYNVELKLKDILNTSKLSIFEAKLMYEMVAR